MKEELREYKKERFEEKCKNGFHRWSSFVNIHKYTLKAVTLFFLIIVFIVICFLVVFSEKNDVFNYGYTIWHLKFFNHFFVDNDNKFNWIGITALVTIIGLTINSWDSRRRYRADLISKSRIEWIGQLRPIVSEYLISILDYIHERKQLIVFKEQGANRSQIDDEIRRMGKLYSEFNKEYSMLMMFIPDNQSNSIIIKQIKKLRLFVLHVNEKKVEEKKIDLKLGLLVEDTIKQVNYYLKNEWERAKQGR